MSVDIVAAKGDHEKIGYELGVKLAGAIRQNIYLQDQDVAVKGLGKEDIYRFVNQYAAITETTSVKIMEGLSRGSDIPFETIIRFNALETAFEQEECTTFAAVGKATENGKAVLLKNRDTSGNYEFDGPEYYKNRAINVVLALKTDDGNVMVGVSKAGSTGFMMGLNRYGVAAASNFGHTIEVMQQSSKELYGISGRPQMLREGLEYRTASEAVNLILSKLTKSSMRVPGILWFVDATNIYVIEGSHKQFAVQHVTDGAVSRSNHFELLNQLNNETEVSAICRKIRAKELIEQNYGSINMEKLIEFSMDHKNGPSENSICRHSNNPEESVTVSAAIMEIDGENPQKSTISVALGSPCLAWAKERGNITFRMDEDIETIPQRFINGTAYKEFIRNEYSI
jgi:hypothetical protein